MNRKIGNKGVKGKSGVVNAGIIGCGYFARVQHMPNIDRSKKMRIRALCDLNPVPLEKSVKQYKPDYGTQNMRDLMRDDKLDCIFIVVSHDLHQRLVCEVAPSGKAIFIEKPMALTMSECGKIVKSVRKYKNKLMVGFNRRFAPSMIDVKNAYQKREGEALITYRIVADRVRYGGGKIDMKKWGGDLVGETCHIFDLLRWLTEEEPINVYSEGRWDDNTITTVRFTNDIVSAIISGGIGDVRYPKERLEIFRDRSTIINDHFLELEDWLYHRPISKEVWTRHKQYRVGALYSNKTFGKGIDKHKKESIKRIPIHDRVKKATGNYEIVLPAPDKGHLAEIEAFADCIINDKPSPTDEIAGSCATLLGLKAIESVKTGKPQKVKPSEYFLSAKNRGKF